MTDSSAARRIAAIAIATAFASHLLGALLTSYSLFAFAAQAFVCEWGAGRAGMVWSESQNDATSARVAKRVLLGVAWGLAAAAAFVLFMLTLGGATLAENHVSVATLTGGLLVAGLVAVQRELLLRAFLLRLISGHDRIKLAVCALASFAHTWGTPQQGFGLAVANGLMGTVFARAWLRDRGAILPCSLHAAWLFGTGALVRGGWLDVRTSGTNWGGPSDLLAGYAALVPLILFAGIALFAPQKARSSYD